MTRSASALAAALLLAACGGEHAIPRDVALLRVTVGADEVAPGQGFPLTVLRVWRKDMRPSPLPDAAFAPLSVVHEATTRREDAERVEETRRYRAYAFTRKDVTIPSLPLLVEGAAGPPFVTRSEPARMRVRPALDPQRPGQPEGPGAPPGAPTPWLAWVLVAALLCAAAAVGLLRRRRGALLREAPAALPRSPAARALAALQAIGATTPDGRDAVAADVVRLADVVRDFLAAQYGLRARRRTTPEILAALGGSRADPASVLVPCDLVKFAGRVADLAERARLLERARSYVRAASGERAS